MYTWFDQQNYFFAQCRIINAGILNSSLDGSHGILLRALCLQYIPFALGDLYVSVFLAMRDDSVNARYLCVSIYIVFSSEFYGPYQVYAPGNFFSSSCVSRWFCVISLQLRPTSFIRRNKDGIWFLCCDFIQSSEMYVIPGHFTEILGRPFHCLGHFMVECVLSSYLLDQVGRTANVWAAKVRISGFFNEIYRQLSVYWLADDVG